jgi:alpha-L-arabinofuranosidase
VKGPGYDSSSYGYVNVLDTSAILGDGILHVFLVNRNLGDAAHVELHHPGGQLLSVDSAEIVTGPRPNASNTFEQPNLVVNQPFDIISIQDGLAHVELPPLSIVAVTFQAI